MRFPTMLVPLLATLLAGCTLGSDEPFVTQGDVVPGLIEGSYQRYLVVQPGQLRAVPAAIRGDCIAPGYAFRIADEKGRPAHRQLRPSYCPYDGEQRLPRIGITRVGSDYWLVAPDQRQSVRFRRLREGIYLIQSDNADGEGLRYGYALTREAPGGIDIALLSCEYFPALKSTHETVATNAAEMATADTAPAPEPWPEPAAPEASAVLPGQRGDCRAPSLAAIQPELDAVVDRFAQGRELVWVLLRRVPAD